MNWSILRSLYRPLLGASLTLRRCFPLRSVSASSSVDHTCTPCAPHVRALADIARHVISTHLSVESSVVALNGII